MNEIAKWCTLIVSCSALCVIVEFLIPRGQVGKYMNVVLSLFALGALLNSISVNKINFQFSTKQFDKIQNSKENMKLLKSINNQIENLSSDSLKATLREYFADYKINPKKIDVFMDKNEDNCIVLVRCKIYIDKAYIHLAENLKNQIEQKFKIQVEFTEI